MITSGNTSPAFLFFSENKQLYSSTDLNYNTKSPFKVYKRLVKHKTTKAQGVLMYDFNRWQPVRKKNTPSIRDKF